MESAPQPKADPNLMPRAVARLSLAVIDTKIERLHSISHEEALAEGTTGKDTFHELWRELYGVEEWAKNPLVWAI